MGPGGGGGDNNTTGGPELDANNKELDVLKAENSNLRRMLESLTSNLTTTGQKSSVGHILGSGSSGGGDMNISGVGVDEYRQNMHMKWENEKKLQKRLSVIENRLKEKVDENQDLMNQLKHARETAHTAIANKDDMSRKVGAVTKLTQESRKLTVDDLMAIEQARSRVYTLEG